MKQVNPLIESLFDKEPMFQIFKHDGLICCVQRLNWSGAINGYVAVPIEHPLYGKDYNFEIEVDEDPKFNGNYFGLLAAAFRENATEKVYPLSLAIDVHGGLTFASKSLGNISPEVFGDVWWFGFDTSHAGDMKCFLTEIDMKYFSLRGDEVYRDFEYVKQETKSLAEQLQKFAKP